MKSKILERYTMLPDGRYVIEINAGKMSDLYDDFDSYTPYVRKELDQDLVEYITDSARDLCKETFLIRFYLLATPDEEMKTRITASINSYFLYLKTIELRELARIMRTSSILFVVGVALLFITVWVNKTLSADASVLTQVFAHGLTVAAWVSLWEALATFLINWAPYSRQIKLYERIARAPVEFMPAPSPADTVNTKSA
jgi:hypothetical protein